MSNEWHLTKIPKVMHVYFGGRMSYARYLTIATFKKLNPDWRVKFYYPKTVNIRQTWETPEHKLNFVFDDYFGKAIDMADEAVELVSEHNISEVHKSDFLRWKLLSTEGGLWSDMDIIYLKPMSSLSFNSPGMVHIDTCVCIGVYGHSVGFLLASPHNITFSKINSATNSVFRSGDYQCIGSLLCNSVLPLNPPAAPSRIRRHKHRPRRSPTVVSTTPFTSNVYNMPMDIVYAYDAQHIRDLFIGGDISKITTNTIGVHWFGGSEESSAFLQRTKGGENFDTPPAIEKIIKDLSYEK